MPLNTRTPNITAIHSYICMAQVCEKYCRWDAARNAWIDAANEAVNESERQRYLHNAECCRRHVSSSGQSFTAEYTRLQTFRIYGTVGVAQNIGPSTGSVRSNRRNGTREFAPVHQNK